MLRLALEVADRILPALPAPVAYALADVAADLWHRWAPARRGLVAANLARVCEATGRPTRGPAFTALVRSAFRNYARYYVELIRAPHYPVEDIDRHVDVPQWPAFAAALRDRPGILVSAHLGNFEPFGTFLAAHGLRPLAPVEEIEPRALYEFLLSRRGSGKIDVVPLSDARALIRRLRDGGLVGIIADRDLGGDGQEVTMFGHPRTMPVGPAALAVAHRAGLVVGRCLRVGPDRFLADGEVVELPPPGGDRRASTADLVRTIAARMEADIAAAPEQWWGAFQPFWPDLREA